MELDRLGRDLGYATADWMLGHPWVFAVWLLIGLAAAWWALRRARRA